MNKSRRHRPRLICSVVRLWESSRGPAATGCSHPAARHMRGCAECREFFAEDIGFEQSLRRDATRLGAARPEAGLEQRILRAVKAAEARPEPGRELSPVWGFGLLASAAAALAVVLWVHLSGPEPVASPVVATKATVVTPEPGIAPETVVAAPAIAAWWSALEARGTELAKAEKNPLEREIDSVRTDARAVFGFLALNFMPSKAIPETPPSRG